jgi:hypothetical protein
VKKSKKSEKTDLNFASLRFGFEAKMTKSKRSEKCKEKISEKMRKKRSEIL